MPAMRLPVSENPSEHVVWFDLDDTLWDFKTNSREALFELFDEFELFRFWDSRETWITDYHTVNDRLWAQLSNNLISLNELRTQRFLDTFLSADIPVERARKMAEKADTFYLNRLGCRSKLKDGARELLLRTKAAGFRTGILSNGFREVQYDKLTSGGIRDLIDYIVLSDEIGISKPNPEIYRCAEKVASTLPERCIMIGDNSDTDISGALTAGWSLAIWFNPNHNLPSERLVAALRNPGALWIVEELDQIII